MAGTTGMTRKSYTLPNLNDIENTFSTVKANELDDLAPEKRGVKIAERTPLMLKFDEYAAEMYAAWEAEDKPQEFGGNSVRKVAVAPDAVDGTKFLIRKSAEFVGNHGVRFGKPSEPRKDGRVLLAWMVTDKRERKSKADTNGDAS